MSEPLSSDLQVVEEAPDEVRCLIPSGPPRLGCYLMAFGTLAPTTLGAILLTTASFQGDAAVLTLLLPLVLFALFLTGMGLWLAASHVEVAIRRGTLRSVARLGPLRWSR